MRATDVLDELTCRGLSVRLADDGKLMVSPVGAITPDVASVIKECRAELVAALEDQRWEEWRQEAQAANPFAGGPVPDLATAWQQHHDHVAKKWEKLKLLKKHNG